ncbi:MAG: DUF1365 domain-containing protein [Pseudorhodoplanes sp.]|uniref:DUF1365 domain-containing protein n=1 Tax=Pseudorhodoplanes sp. TaxID=1934341 RepID=UPI003D10DF7A
MTARPQGQNPPALLYRGEVMHARLKPVPHRFVYRVLNLLIDLDRLDEAGRLSPLFGVNRRGVFSFRERDHGPRDGTPLAGYVRSIAAGAGVDLSRGRIMLLCYPRLLGYAFNPLSVYYCYRSDGTLALLVYEVRNTFGGHHSYVCPVSAAQTSAAGIRQSHPKRLYVSPFIGMDMRYHFRLTLPGDELKLRILETDDQGPLLAASFHGRRQTLTSPHLVAAFCTLPLVTLKVMVGIHYEAARLWLKGVRFHPGPQRASAPRSADQGHPAQERPG